MYLTIIFNFNLETVKTFSDISYYENDDHFIGSSFKLMVEKYFNLWKIISLYQSL